MTNHSCQETAKHSEETRIRSTVQPKTATIGICQCRLNPILHSIHASHTETHPTNQRLQSGTTGELTVTHTHVSSTDEHST
jgi:hypothetical protein